MDKELTHAIAPARARTKCDQVELSDGAKAVELADEQKKHAAIRLNKADRFFNQWKLHRAGVEEDGEKLICFIERMRDKEILRQSGEVLPASLRRLEVAMLNKANDDWDFAETRRIYREEQPLGSLSALKHERIETLGNVRVIDTVKDLGIIPLP